LDVFFNYLFCMTFKYSQTLIKFCNCFTEMQEIPCGWALLRIWVPRREWRLEWPECIWCRGIVGNSETESYPLSIRPDRIADAALIYGSQAPSFSSRILLPLIWRTCPFVMILNNDRILQRISEANLVYSV